MTPIKTINAEVYFFTLCLPVLFLCLDPSDVQTIRQFRESSQHICECHYVPYLFVSK